MYKFIRKKEYAMTRDVFLKNLETGTEDYCFDDSGLVNIRHKSFYFMEIGKEYDCKILLFGGIEPSEVGEKLLCRVVRDNVACGNGRLVEVSAGEDRYYVLRSEVEDQLKDGEFYYYYTRKDLVQVDDIIHGDFLD